jgi:hypothetical protein
MRRVVVGVDVSGGSSGGGGWSGWGLTRRCRVEDVLLAQAQGCSSGRQHFEMLRTPCPIMDRCA